MNALRVYCGGCARYVTVPRAETVIVLGDGPARLFWTCPRCGDVGGVSVADGAAERFAGLGVPVSPTPEASEAVELSDLLAAGDDAQPGGGAGL